MSGKWTKGPWLACSMVHAERGDQMTPEELGEYVTNNVRKTRENGGLDHFLFISTHAPDAPDICHVGNGPNGPANARLIAAAPTLAEALEWLLASIEADPAAENYPGDKEDRLLLARGAARQALSLARGEQ